jgi:hypothetical protein
MRPASWNDAWLYLPLLGFLAASQAPESKAEEVVLGGPRQAKAAITATGSDYAITVTMLPVKSFHPATNAPLNRDKARSLALRALARHLSDKPEVHMVVSGPQVTKAGLEGDVFTLTLRVPRRGLTIVAAEDGGGNAEKTAATATSERISVPSTLLTRKQDTLDTLERLVRESERCLKACKEAAANHGREQAFYLSIAELEDRAQANLDKLSAEVNTDALLLKVEKEELLRSIQARKESVLVSLKEAVQEFERGMKKDKNP